MNTMAKYERGSELSLLRFITRSYVERILRPTALITVCDTNRTVAQNTQSLENTHTKLILLTRVSTAVYHSRKVIETQRVCVYMGVLRVAGVAKDGTAGK